MHQSCGTAIVVEAVTPNPFEAAGELHEITHLGRKNRLYRDRSLASSNVRQNRWWESGTEQAGHIQIDTTPWRDNSWLEVPHVAEATRRVELDFRSIERDGERRLTFDRKPESDMRRIATVKNELFSAWTNLEAHEGCHAFRCEIRAQQGAWQPA
jgi:hypothetical protein